MQQSQTLLELELRPPELGMSRASADRHVELQAQRPVVIAVGSQALESIEILIRAIETIAQTIEVIAAHEAQVGQQLVLGLLELDVETADFPACLNQLGPVLQGLGQGVLPAG